MTQPAESTPAAPTAVPTPPVSTAPTPEAAAPAESAPFDPKSLPPEAQAYLREQISAADMKARTTTRDNAARAAREEVYRDLGRQLGYDNDDEPPDPEVLSQHLEQSQQDAAARAIELRIYEVGADLGLGLADVRGLLDSRAFCDAVDNLEVSTYAELDAAVAQLIQQRLGSRAPASSSRTPLAALRPGALPGTPEPSIDDQIAEATRAGRVREVIKLQNRKLAALAANQH